MEIDQVNQTEIQKLISKHLTQRASNELEVRFGRFQFNRETKRSNFVSEVEIPFFYNLKRALDKGTFTKTTKKTTDYNYSFGQTNDRSTLKRTVNEDGSEEYILKNGRKMYRDVFDYDFRVSLASEQKLNAFPSELNIDNFNLVRDKDRISYTIPIGRIDMTIVTERGQSDSVTRTKYEVEMEINNDRSVTYESIMVFVNIILQIKQNNHIVITNRERRTVIEGYKNLFNLKGNYFVGAQPETLQKNGIANLYKEKYSVTDKADGDRAFMFIDKDKRVYFIDNNINAVYKTNLTSPVYNNTVIDGELVHIDNKTHFLAFDLVAYNGKDLRGDSNYLLTTRLNRLNHITNTITSNESYIVKMKKFYYNNVFLGSEVILDNIDKKPYKNDGLIFTPMEEPYPTVKKWTKLLKWKPAELNTIDFYAKKVGDSSPSIWELYVQHADNTKVNTSREATQYALFDVEKLCGVPNTIKEMTFQTSFDDTLIDPTTNESFKSDTVIEFMWDKSQNKFVPLRTRWDKTANPSKHGNFSTVACSIWDNIHNPVDKDLLFKFTTYSKQSQHNDFFFERMRRFHNKVKEHLYNKYANNCEYLLELCSGKGGDLHKWTHNNVKNVTGYDICEKSITECRRRVSSNGASVNSSNYTFHQTDLCQPEAYTKILSDRQHPYDVVSCQFGVHYFFQSESTFTSLLNILNNSLVDGGHFMVTFMDAHRVKDMLKDENKCVKEIDNEIVYYINGGTNNHKQFGNNVRIVLSGNNVLKEGSNEYLVDVEMFKDTMKNNGFEAVEDGMFGDIYPNFVQQYNLEPLSSAEKDISFLNRMCVFRKGSVAAADIPSKYTMTQVVSPQTLFNFDTIQLQDKIQVYKIATKYDVVDIVNCIEYKYYKNNIEDKAIESFRDIVSTFDDLKIQYIPIYVADPMNVSDKFTKQHLRFTYHKHVVEKKTPDGEIEETQYDNWYIVMYKNKLLYTEPIEQPKPTQQDEQSEPKGATETKLDTSVTTRKQQIVQEIQKSKVTIKLLKEYLTELGLKVTGKKEDLINRLMEYCQQ